MRQCQTAFDNSVHLGFGDVAIDNPSSPSFVRVRIKQSKTDPFRRGVDLFLGLTHTDLCPVATILGYLVVWGAPVQFCGWTPIDEDSVCG